MGNRDYLGEKKYWAQLCVFSEDKPLMKFLSFFYRYILCAFLLLMSRFAADGRIVTGAENMGAYIPGLQGKRVGLLINQTSVVGNAKTLLVDTLLRRHIQVVKIFAPEHGFRGKADAGAHVDNDRDSATGLPIISLYGDNKKPKKSQLEDIDILVYDLQDVGVRFYTYISTLQYAMVACAEAGKQLMILDRPDPNGHYVDGPVLDTAFRSFVGMQPVPVIYGMTAGEYAKMLVGEHWIKDAAKLKLEVVSCRNYDHQTKYALPVAPSPNLKNMTAIYLYPSLCLFEGTVVSVGRGTDSPFQQFGHPDFMGKADYSFTPKGQTGASKPLYENKACYGVFIAGDEAKALALVNNQFSLKWLLQAYQWSPDKTKFFNAFFEKLAGTDVLRKQIEAGKTEVEIRKSWQPQLNAFKAIRKKYLLYPDFQ